MQTLKKSPLLLNIVFIIQLVLVVFVAGGILPRWLILILAGLVSVYVLIDSLDNALVFFVRSIPLFVAIPFTSYFDSFNIWRFAAGLIFLKWFFTKDISQLIRQQLGHLIKRPIQYFLSHQITTAVAIFFFMSLLSLLTATDLFAGIKRIIYLVNLSLVGVVIFDLARSSDNLAPRLIKNLVIPGVIVVALGFIQLAMTYWFDIFAFIEIWQFIQESWYGSFWARIVVEGNTWFAYFGPQLSLRMFSIFPDSHTFPMFVLLTIPSILALALTRVVKGATTLRELVRGRASLWILFLPVFYLAIILSGTRGIWLAVFAPLISLPFIRKKIRDIPTKKILSYISLFSIAFFILFLIANPILTSNQFLLDKGNNDLLRQRIRSIIDFGETSNSDRLEIWSASVKSIYSRPLLGVGIGNFPVVLDQDIDQAKAGSSAHNLYLNIAAEIGLVGLFVALAFLWSLLLRGIRAFEKTRRPFLKIYLGSVLFYLIWIFAYLLTDAALFDERAFLIFSVHAALIFSLYEKIKRPEPQLESVSRQEKQQSPERNS
ncbi:MAG: hypothetical protein COV31_01350 [Candidatus Yanofskybacteria bacterium CG10_big_fil_rev_8_21_14_0_10_46_23]|uniref:O-antigen ligase-related domain-containing protein n=1 Tax=Candidatus Yanofskybacteria bacterium CG10_big_fil_rev_8_21_14_0_10_46_23 TaxID=1975098 RepID=A0A2H0R4Q0_9BACT|nr:MAG: hypothetical protein COV31_01350 [Candidatus Yanofskybacteria bacterium CG10_big_fil_rev_8_21_14_0_10_46_23]